jgi:hypothetical protein
VRARSGPLALEAVAWYAADALLVTAMLAIVKAIGRDLPSVQMICRLAIEDNTVGIIMP